MKDEHAVKRLMLLACEILGHQPKWIGTQPFEVEICSRCKEHTKLFPRKTYIYRHSPFRVPLNFL